MDTEGIYHHESTPRSHFEPKGKSLHHLAVGSVAGPLNCWIRDLPSPAKFHYGGNKFNGFSVISITDQNLLVEFFGINKQKSFAHPIYVLEVMDPQFTPRTDL